jgi:hypothetical protein
VLPTTSTLPAPQNYNDLIYFGGFMIAALRGYVGWAGEPQLANTDDKQRRAACAHDAGSMMYGLLKHQIFISLMVSSHSKIIRFLLLHIYISSNTI